MSKNIKYNDHLFSKVPDGFIKMDLVITFTPKEIKVWEEHIFKMLVRDWYIFYAKVDKFGDGEFIELHFFCQPQYEASITYRIGILFQTLFERESKERIFDASHRVPDNYPNCILIESEQVSKGNLDDKPSYRCPECHHNLWESAPGKHQCVSVKCVTNKKQPA